MNKKAILLKLTIILVTLILDSHLFFTLYYTIWISKSILTSYYVGFFSLNICYFFVLIIEIPFIGNKTLHFIRKVGFFIYITFFSIMILYEIIVFSIQLKNFENYWINCPFTINEPYANLHYKRRCELYNINNNSRYKYQYICSYDSFEDFGYEYKTYYNGKVAYTAKSDKKIKREIEDEFMQCVPVKSVIFDNEIVNSFNEEYLNEEKHYCGRTNQPKKNNYVKDKECNNNTKKNLFILFLFISFSQVVFVFLFFLYKIEDLYNYRYDNEGRNENPNNNENVNQNVHSFSSTKTSKSNDIIDFKILNTKNIIYVNKKEEIIDQNIENVYIDNSNKTNNNSNFSGENISEIKGEDNKNISS